MGGGRLTDLHGPADFTDLGRLPAIVAELDDLLWRLDRDNGPNPVADDSFHRAVKAWRESREPKLGPPAPICVVLELSAAEWSRVTPGAQP